MWRCSVSLISVNYCACLLRNKSPRVLPWIAALSNCLQSWSVKSWAVHTTVWLQPLARASQSRAPVLPIVLLGWIRRNLERLKPYSCKSVLLIPVGAIQVSQRSLHLLVKCASIGKSIADWSSPNSDKIISVIPALLGLVSGRAASKESCAAIIITLDE